MTNATGQFTLQNIPPATYKIFAIAPVDMATFFDPSVMKKFESNAQNVTVAESSSVTVRLKVLR